MAFFVELAKTPRRREPVIRCDGRNVEVFDRLRFWAYATVSEWRCGSQLAWTDFVAQRALTIAAAVREGHPSPSHPFSDKEVLGIAKSVSRWVWRRYTGANLLLAQAHSAVRLAHDRSRAEAKRRANGSLPRDEYLAPSSSAVAPLTRFPTLAWASRRSPAACPQALEAFDGGCLNFGHGQVRAHYQTKFPIFISTMAVSVFHAGAREYGLLTSIMAIGSVAGALLAAGRAKPHSGISIAGSALFGCTCALAAFMPDYWLFGLALVVVGISAQTFTTTANSIVQLSTEPRCVGAWLRFC